MNKKIGLLRKGSALAALALLIGTQHASGATFRWAASSNRIYVEGGGSATLTQIKAALPNAPLILVDAANKVWFLKANLMVKDGTILRLAGSTAGGDVNELRLLSNNSSSTSYVVLDADYGTIDIDTARITSWDEAINGPDTEYLVHKRAFVRARSRLSGAIPQESRLNVVDSEIAYLGFNDRESYALTWQIVTLNAGLKVFGTVRGSHIHDCQLSVATWSVDDVAWETGTEINSDTLYSYDSGNPAHLAVLGDNNVHDNDYGATFRYSATSQAMYVTGPGVAALSDLKAALPTAPLTLVDATQMIWHLGADLVVEKGAKLKLYGPALDGDVGELRLKSENDASPHAFVEIKADFGWIDIRKTKILSWNSAVNGPDLETDVYRRAFIRARSSLAPDGITPRESRMDIIESDIGYLGSHNAEAYGLVWKVIGTHPDPTKSLFDYVEVYGDIIGSRLHHNYFGMYSFGHQGGSWINNEVDNNIGYGFDPHDDSDNLLIAHNNVHHNGWHGIIASRRCDHLAIQNNLSWANGKNGIMLHRHCHDSLIENNQAFLNGDSGVALFDNDRTLVRNNLILSNLASGIRLSVGCADNVIDNNEIGFSGKYGFYFYAGTDPAEADPDDPEVTNRSRRTTLSNNYVHHATEEGIKLADSDENVFINNTFLANGSVLRFATSTGNLFVSNSVPTDVIIKVAGTTAMPSWLHLEKQPSVRLQFDDPYASATISDDEGAIFDFDEGGLFTAVDLEGSFRTVSSANIGVATTVVTRNLHVTVDSGGAQINPTAWDVATDRKKVWLTKAGVSTQSITYAVGDLLPTASYNVTKDGALLTTLTSDGDGLVTFTDVPGSLKPIEYTVEP